jgi:hypothetical protein
VPVRGPLSLGTLRQIAVENASGSLICQWDDDDYNHSHRLSNQIVAMKSAGAEASYLADNLHFFSDTRTLYWCDWHRPRLHVGHPGTLLAYKSALPRYNELLDRREDLEVQQSLRVRSRIALLHDAGYLYIYVYHGSNVFDREHHARLVTAYGLGSAELLNRRSILSRALGEYSYYLQCPIIVSDTSGLEVFEWSGSDPDTLTEDDNVSLFSTTVLNPIRTRK